MRQGVAGICVVVLAVALAACGVARKQSTVEGKLADGEGRTLGGVKIMATQVQPLKGYEQVEAETSVDGTFRLSGLFPSSQYILQPWVQNWTAAPLMGVKFQGEVEWALFTETGWFSSNMTTIQTGPEGETLILSKPLLFSPMIALVEGKVVDGKGQPRAGVTIIASQEKPVKGYERFEVVTKEDGTFALPGLFPDSIYEIFPATDETCGGTWKSPSPGDAERLSEQILIRFERAEGGVIYDSQTGLEWVVGPDQDMDYADSEQWVASCRVAGGGWRVATRQELASLYQTGVGERNMNPAFKTTGWWMWAEPLDSSRAYLFNFEKGLEYRLDRDDSMDMRVFAVRSRE